MSDHPDAIPDSDSGRMRCRGESCVIDLSARAVFRDDERIDVEAKVFDLIELLLRHRDRAMSKRELGDALWGDRAVTDAALSQLLRKARRALGDDGETQRFIRTVHGRGLQWIAPVDAEPPISPDQIMEPAQAGLVASQPIPTDPQEAPLTGHGKSPGRKLPAVLLGLGLLVAVALAATMLVLKHQDDASGKIQAAAVRIQVLPTRDHSGQADLEWTSTGLMGLISSLIRNEPGIEVLLAASRNGKEALSDVDTADAPSLERLQSATGATHVVATELRKLGSVFELELQVLALDGDAAYREVLRGSSPAALAADAAERVQSRFRRATASRDKPLFSEIRDPFIAEVYARGLDAQLRGDQAGARKYFDICLDHQPELLWPRLHLAIAQIATGDSTVALENAQRVEKDANARGLTALHIQALRQLASIAFRTGDLDGAARHLDVAMHEIASIDQPLLLSDLLVAHGSIESERGQWKLAGSQLDEAHRLAIVAGDRRREANALTNLAVVDNAMGDSDAALGRLRAALDAARAAGDGALEISILLNLGGAEHNSGRPLDAAVLLKQSLRLAKQSSDRQGQIFSAVMLSWILAAFDHDEDARRLAEAVAAIGEKEGNPFWQAEAQWALSNLASRRQEWPKALVLLTRALDIHRSNGMSRNSGQVLADIVHAAAEAGDMERARSTMQAYRALVEGDPDDAQLAEHLEIMEAQLRYAEGDFRGASGQLGTFLRVRKRDRGPAVQAALFQLGNWQIAAKEFDAFLAEPAWTTWLVQTPDAIKLRIKALEFSGNVQDSATEAARLRRMQESDALQLEPDLFLIP